MRDKWYYADQNKYFGPFKIEELRKKLIVFPNAARMFVWCAGFSDWKRAGEVSELKAFLEANQASSPNAPRTSLLSYANHHEGAKQWTFQWWWVFAAAPIILLLSLKIVVGNNDGRTEMKRLIGERRAIKGAKARSLAKWRLRMRQLIVRNGSERGTRE